MLIKFRTGRGEESEIHEWSGDAVPRVGEKVQLDKFISGYVDDVIWKFGNNRGEINQPPYVFVILNDG